MGGAGGGALFIAAQGTITINGAITANGGVPAGSSSGGGAGGSIRLLADRVDGEGGLSARGGGVGTHARPGGSGRISIEANSIALLNATVPEFVASAPDVSLLWPPPDAPKIRATVVGGLDVDPEPAALFETPDLELASGDGVELRIEAENIPLNAAFNVHVIPASGEPMDFPALFESGDMALSTWRAIISLPAGIVSAVEVRADLP